MVMIRETNYRTGPRREGQQSTCYCNERREIIRYILNKCWNDYGTGKQKKENLTYMMI